MHKNILYTSFIYLFFYDCPVICKISRIHKVCSARENGMPAFHTSSSDVVATALHAIKICVLVESAEVLADNIIAKVVMVLCRRKMN